MNHEPTKPITSKMREIAARPSHAWIPVCVETPADVKCLEITAGVPEIADKRALRQGRTQFQKR